MSGKRILVTGGAGFLGSHLCERLVGLGHHVLCLDNFHTGRWENIVHLVKEKGFEVLEQDVCSPFHAEVEEIYNLACPASPVHYQFDPVKTTRTCVEGAIHVLDLARRTGAKVLQASTSEVYGDPQVHPQPESYRGNVNPIGPRSCYDEGKRCAETLFFDYFRQYGVPIKVARIFNTYGPRMLLDDGRVVSNFIVQALRGAPLTIYGDGTQTRSFCFVEDMVEGLMALMAAPGAVTGPVNLGNPEEISMRDLADRLTAMTGSASPIEFLPLPEDDPMQRKPDIALALRVLGWQPKTGLAQGLKPTVGYFSAILASDSQGTVHKQRS